MDSSKKVLVVEDDEVVLVLISHILTRQSYTVHTSRDALEASRLLEDDSWDAILMDLKMPNGGVEFIRALEARNPDLLRKIIIVTGAITEAQKLAGMPLHATVRKPFEVAALLETVKNCVDRKA